MLVGKIMNYKEIETQNVPCCGQYRFLWLNFQDSFKKMFDRTVYGILWALRLQTEGWYSFVLQVTRRSSRRWIWTWASSSLSGIKRDRWRKRRRKKNSSRSSSSTMRDKKRKSKLPSVNPGTPWVNVGAPLVNVGTMLNCKRVTGDMKLCTTLLNYT